MHAEALAWVTAELKKIRAREPERLFVLELGSRDVNGSARGAIQVTRWHGVDREPGPGVDEVANAETYDAPEFEPDVVVCTEVLEHAERADLVFLHAVAALRPGGTLLVTAACDPRAPHSAVDGGPLRAGEHYRNVTPEQLHAWLEAVGYESVLALDTKAAEPFPWTLSLLWEANRGDFYMRLTKPETTWRRARTCSRVSSGSCLACHRETFHSAWRSDEGPLHEECWEERYDKARAERRRLAYGRGVKDREERTAFAREEVRRRAAGEPPAEGWRREGSLIVNEKTGEKRGFF